MHGWPLSRGVAGLEPALRAPPCLPMPLSVLLALPAIVILTPAFLLVACCVLILLPALIAIHVLMLPVTLYFIAPALMRQPYIDAVRTRERTQQQRVNALFARPSVCRSHARIIGAMPARTA